MFSMDTSYINPLFFLMIIAIRTGVKRRRYFGGFIFYQISFLWGKYAVKRG
jgi:hypothetical protein